MIDPHHENGAMENPPAAQESEEQLQAGGAARRRLAKAGLGATGIILTLSGRSALAATGTCKSPSGFLSGNTSSHGAPPICEGRSPGYWKNHDGWPIPRNTLFRNVFSCAPNSVYRNFTLGQLISPQQEDKNKLAMHLIAALLNARQGWTPFLTEERIKSMFTEWQADGTFSPSAGVNWNAQQIVLYLQATQD